MQKEILRVINKCEEMGWITVNEHLNKEALAAAFMDILKEMSLKKAIEIFVPNDFL